LRASPSVTNNSIIGNSAGWGGGIYVYNCSPIIANNTITSNSAETHAGGIKLDSSRSTVFNNVVAFNTSGIANTYNIGHPLLRYNCCYGNHGFEYLDTLNPSNTDGIFVADPRFVRDPIPGADGQWGTEDDVYGNVRLQQGSPCIDAGDNAAVLPQGLRDLGGKTRMYDDPYTTDTGTGTVPLVDIGAYEYQPSIPVDFNDDGRVDPADAEIFIACGTGPAVQYLQGNLPFADCPLWPGMNTIIPADFDADGDVDQVDFGVFQRFYGPAEPGSPAPTR
jgi:hypothetical protein